MSTAKTTKIPTPEATTRAIVAAWPEFDEVAKNLAIEGLHQVRSFAAARETFRTSL